MFSFLRRLRWYLGRRRFESDMAEELRFHESLAAEEAARRGAEPDAAHQAARRRLGNDAQLREAARSIWTVPWLEGLARDLRYALRALRHRPGFAIASILTLALGIGATTALWSVLDPVLLRPLPYHQSERLVALLEVNRDRPNGQIIISPANALNWRDRSHSLQDIALYSWSSVTLADEPVEAVWGRAVTTNMFRLLGAAPMLGRSFAPEDTTPGAPRAVILSHALWQRRFGGDPALVGRPLRTREGPAVIIGVMPPGFRRLGDEEYWTPLAATTELRTPHGRWLMAVGRLAATATAETATADLGAIARGLATEYPRFDTGWTARAVPLAEQITGQARPILWLLAAAIGVVLLVACANVANLHLGQAIARRGELALRAALGASRGQVIRQWLVEGLVLAALGGAAGVGLAAVGVHALVTARITQIPRLEDVGIDFRVLAFAALVTALAGLGSGLAPALVVREGRLRGVITGHAGGDPSPRAGRLRAGLVVLQVALCFMLLIGAGLVIRSLHRVLDRDIGLDPAGVVTFEEGLPEPDYPTAARRITFFEELARRVGALPGVRSVGLAEFLPVRRMHPATSFKVVGEPEPAPGQSPVTQVNVVNGAYFAALQIPLLAGRVFGPEDRAGGPRVVMVSHALARMLGSDHDALGKQLKISWNEPDSAFTVVGVAGDVRAERIDGDIRPMVYFPVPQAPTDAMTLVVRGEGGNLPPAAALRGAIRALDPGLPAPDAEVMTARVRDALADRRYPMQLLSLLGALATALVSVGLYGVLAYAVAQRQRELGVRRAIGASEGAVLRLIFGAGFRYVALGLGIGLAGAVAGTRMLGALLFEVSPTDPPTLAGAAAIVVVVALAASWIPARRAARVDPVIALRGEG